MIWDEATLSKLRALWATGLSTSKIGAELNCSKNSIVGKVHRLELESRPSPIRRGKKKPLVTRPTGPRMPKVSTVVQFPRAPATAVPATSLPPLASEIYGPPPAGLAPRVLRSPPSLAVVPTWSDDPAPAPMFCDHTGQVREADKKPWVHDPNREKRRSDGSGCLFPFGTPGDPNFRFCDDPLVSFGKPYCPEHARTAYVRVPDRRQDSTPYVSRMKQNV